jgi:hypothetical protein
MSFQVVPVELLADEKSYCWGSNRHGPLGDGATGHQIAAEASAVIALGDGFKWELRHRSHKYLKIRGSQPRGRPRYKKAARKGNTSSEPTEQTDQMFSQNHRGIHFIGKAKLAFAMAARSTKPAQVFESSTVTPRGTFGAKGSSEGRYVLPFAH